jgi:hypothetical protein
MAGPTLVGSVAANNVAWGGSYQFTRTTAGGNLLVIAGYLNNAGGASFADVIHAITDNGVNTWSFSAGSAASPPTVPYNDGNNFDQECAFVAWCTDAIAITHVTLSTTDAGWAEGNLFASLSEWSNYGGVDLPANGATGSSGSSFMTPAISLASAADAVVLAVGGSGFDNSLPAGFSHFGLYDNTSYGTPGSSGSWQGTIASQSGQYAAAVLGIKAISSVVSDLLMGTFP